MNSQQACRLSAGGLGPAPEADRAAAATGPRNNEWADRGQGRRGRGPGGRGQGQQGMETCGSAQAAHSYGPGQTARGPEAVLAPTGAARRDAPLMEVPPGA